MFHSFNCIKHAKIYPEQKVETFEKMCLIIQHLMSARVQTQLPLTRKSPLVHSVNKGHGCPKHMT